MDYILKGDAISMIQLRKIFSDACELHGLLLSNRQKSGVLTSFIAQARKAGLLSDAALPEFQPGDSRL